MFPEDIGTDEIRIQRAEEAEPGFQRRLVRREVGAVQRIAHFQTQTVAGAQAAGFGSCSKKGFKPFDAFLSRAEEFKTIFPGIAGAADNEIRPFRRDAGNSIAGGKFHTGDDAGEYFSAFGTLNSQPHVFVGVVFQGYACRLMGGKPCEVFINLGGVHHYEEGFRFHPVQDKVVNDSGSVIEHDGVLPLPYIQFVDVIGQHGVQPGRGRIAGYRELPHVGDVKDAAGFAHCFVFVQNAGVLHRHIPAGKRNHSGSQFNVFSCQGGGFDVCISHEAM